jgi:aspartyl-tRNA(Asn)/glutamyl-tRNA(Gln) amidotransferase subunit B
MGSLLALLNAEGKSIEASPVSPENLAGLLSLIHGGRISGKIAKTVFDEMAKTGKAAEIIVEEKGLIQVTDPTELEAIISEVMASSAAEVAQYKSGKKKLLGYFVGQVMQKTRGKANPEIVNRILKVKLDE